MTIVYLHGFASTGSSPKAEQLRKRFGQECIISPDLPMDPVKVEDLIYDIVLDFFKTRKPKEKLVFVGTSLGAFYANYFGHMYDCPAVLVNPSTNPSESLQQRLGANTNYMSGEEFMVTMAYLEEFSSMRQYVEHNYCGSLVNLFLAKDDEVIPYQAGLEYFAHAASVTVTEDGGHRFSLHWDRVLDRVEQVLAIQT